MTWMASRNASFTSSAATLTHHDTTSGVRSIDSAIALDYFCNDASCDDKRPGLWQALHVTLVVPALAGFAFHC